MKDLEIEYKNQVATEIPDLWARIEAGINATEVQKTPDQIYNVTDITENKKKSKNTKKIITIFSSVVATAACLVLAFTFVIGSKNRNNEAKATMAMAENIADSYENNSRSFNIFSDSENKSADSYDEETCEESSVAEAATEATFDEAEAEMMTDEEAIDNMDSEDVVTEKEAVNSGLMAETGKIVFEARIISCYSEGNETFIDIEDIQGQTYKIFVPDNLTGDIKELESLTGYTNITVLKYISDEEKSFSDKMWNQVDYEYVTHD